MEEARAARDQALTDTDILILPDYPITHVGRLIVKTYRQKLRDWPSTEGFPDLSTIPQPENWSIYKLQDDQSLPKAEAPEA
jgi:hypothetical protein